MTNTILIAEDDKDIRELMAHAFQSQKFLVVESENGEQAMEVLRQQRVDVLVTDVRMPICDGAMLTRLAKKAMPGLRVVIITGFNDFDAQEAKDLGADGFLHKPFDTYELISVVTTLCAKAKAAS